MIDNKDLLNALMPEFNLYIFNKEEGKSTFVKSIKGPIPRIGETFWLNAPFDVMNVNHEEHPGYPGYSMVNVVLEPV